MTCPSPTCGHTFSVPGSSAPQEAAAAPGGVTSRTGPRAVRPQQTSALPSNVYASPAFVAGCGAVVFLYGLVLFAVMTSQRDREMAAAEADRQRIASRAAVPEPLLVFEPASTANPATPTPSGKGATPPAPQATTEPAPKRDSATPSPAPNPKPPPGQSGVPDPQAVALNVPKPRPAPVTPKNAAAAKSPSPANPAAPDGRTFNGLGSWDDPAHDCQMTRNGDAVVVNLPGSVHILSPELNQKNAPRSVAKVTGDFSIEVKVAGTVRPGSALLPNLPIAFQGAGLIVWQDQDNYLRLERTAISGPNQPLTPQVIVEQCFDGRPGGHLYKDVKDHAVHLKIERRGDELTCSYGPDGKTWLPIKRSSIALFPDKVGVGLSAGNLSPKTFAPRFEEFRFKQGK